MVNASKISEISMTVQIFDSSAWGRITVKGADRLRFLHNQTTQTFQRRQPGEGCETLFVTATARLLDLATAYVETDQVGLVLSPQRYGELLTWLDRYIFPADQVILEDITAQTCCFRILGALEPLTTGLKTLGLTALPTVLHHHHRGVLGGVPVFIAAGSGLPQPGFTLIAAQSDYTALQDILLHMKLPDGTGPETLTPEAWETLRILAGRPAIGAELTEDYNPLEAGLWHTLSFDKGCYIGQETIARLQTYQGVKQHLWGIELTALTTPGTLLNAAGEKVGTLTSVTPTAQGAFGLGYVRRKAGGEGMTVYRRDPEETGNGEPNQESTTLGIAGQTVAVPFLHYP
jgi:folate-binding protein YgfZ